MKKLDFVLIALISDNFDDPKFSVTNDTIIINKSRTNKKIKHYFNIKQNYI